MLTVRARDEWDRWCAGRADPCRCGANNPDELVGAAHWASCAVSLAGQFGATGAVPGRGEELNDGPRGL
ncbi:MAG: hypothetical protein WA927_12395, partial [Rhodococcus sp. (in: high G+C Gram-positive bacteria)]